MQSPFLSPRLRSVAEQIRPCRIMADIGTDHAYLPVHLVRTGVCSAAIASDVKKGPLGRAEETVRRHGLTRQITCRLGSGLSTLRPGEADAIVIAGMGGELIARLLAEEAETARTAKQLILQPMTALPKLREWLQQNHYRTLSENLVQEEEKLYHILEIQPSDVPLPPLLPAERELGPALLAARPPEFVPYVKRRLHKLSMAVEGLGRSHAPDAEEQQREYQQLIDAIVRTTGIS